MNEYELTFIVQPNSDDALRDALKQRLADYLAANGGEVLSVRDWGHRSLAYAIRKFIAGFYVVVRLRAPAEAVDELQRLLRMNEDVLRFIVVRADEVPEPA